MHTFNNLFILYNKEINHYKFYNFKVKKKKNESHTTFYKKDGC